VGYWVDNSEQPYIESLIYHSAQRANILPITSVCNVRCVFCSHRQNPPGVKSYRIPPLSIQQVRQAIEFMDATKPVVIGESVTKIMEGEPLTHPELLAIMAEIRKLMPKTPIQLTTNGNLLTSQMAERLRDFAPITVNLSLNSCSEDTRRKIMGDKLAQQGIAAADVLQHCNIPYHGSIVAMPHMTGWQDLEQSIIYLAERSAQTVRVFLPGYSKLASAELRFSMTLWEQLRAKVAQIRQRVNIPITCEPERLTNLNADVLGVIKNSPAQRGNVQVGDTIVAVSGQQVLSRVHCFNLVLASPNPLLTVVREGQLLSLQLEKHSHVSSGLVMAYDISPEVVEDMELAVRRHRVRNGLALCSPLAFNLLQVALQKLYTGKNPIHLSPVPSTFFAGNIMAAGLLVVEDFAAAYEQLADAQAYELVLLPKVAFDQQGRDLTGQSYLDLQQQWQRPVELI